MGRPETQMWTWTLCVFLSWMRGGQVFAEPQYMVAIPVILEAGAENKFCASLLHPDETLVMTIALISPEKNTTLLQKTSSAEFHTCTNFKAPLDLNEKVITFEVEVRGNTFYSKEVRRVKITAHKPKTFIQTDKPIYLPGQTVNFRVVTLGTKFRPALGLYDIIELQDPYQNRIGQWLNEKSDSKIIQHSYSLNSEAREGIYRLIVTIGEDKEYHSFKVKKYVLPKFDVKIIASDKVVIEQEEIKAEVCAKYTYGQPVPGNVEVKVTNPFISTGNGFFNESQQTDKNGCAIFTLKMSAFKEHDQGIDSLTLSAKVEEEGTGVSRQQEKRIEVSYEIGSLSFIDTPTIYDQGSVLEGKVKAVHYNDTPIPDMLVYLLVGERWSPRELQNLTTDSNGIATFSLSTADLNEEIHLQVSNTPALLSYFHRGVYYKAGHHTVSVAQPPSPSTKTVSSLEVKKKKDEPLACDSEEDISIQYTIIGEKQEHVDVIYLVLSKGVIVGHGFKQVKVQDKPVTEGQVSFRLNVLPEMAPEVKVVAYAVLPSETVIAHSAKFLTEKCFSHKVFLEFLPSSAVPGEESIMKLTAQPDSLCGVSAVDQSVLIEEPGKTLDAEKIFALFSDRELSYIRHELEDPDECLHVRPRRYAWAPGHDEKADPHSVFWNVGLKMATNLITRVPSCLKYKGKEYYPGHYYRLHTTATGNAPNLAGNPFRDAPPPIVTVRTFFPETWIWDLVEVGKSGTRDVSLTVPDTITTWETEAFCLSPQGFGLAPRKELTVFQPFFLDLTLPYSIIRGEHFELKATVFNYLSSCIMVTVTPTHSVDYTLTPLSGDQYTSCLCGNERKTLRWTMAPSTLGVLNVTVKAEAVASHASCDNEIVSVPDRGRIDVVTRSLIVKAEGTEVTRTHSLLLCPKGEVLTKEIDIQIPDNVIEGSARASVSVLGDSLGRALKNLDGLLKMPYGCGEQNMVLLAPNIYILQYLKNTQQLTKAILEKATNFLTSGYQRQLNYKHDNGAYSTFGSGEGNTWLTAFVLRSFAKAKSFIYIDPRIIETSETWLKSKQKKNGCFKKSGKLFNNRMKGGVSDEVTLSAYITAAFLEMNKSVSHPVVNKSLSCLKESIGNISNTYTTALLSYVFTLAGDMETRAHLLQRLDKVASEEGGLLHWSKKAKEKSTSLSVEISSYVLLAKLSVPPPLQDLGNSSRIVRWLTTQQNHYGGFSSTQDTVVALQALAFYSTLVFSQNGASTVTVQGPGGQLTFDINQDNRLLYQEKELQDLTGKYSLEVKGTTCASAQISLHYNIPTPTAVTTLSIKVKPTAVCNSMSHRSKLTLNFTSLHSGKEHTTNMVILDIKVLSGFVPDPESLKKLKGSLQVDRVEQKEDHVLVYLKELHKDVSIHHTLELILEQQVQNLKPAVVKLYDYYQPSDQAETEYIYPCTEA